MPESNAGLRLARFTVVTISHSVLLFAAIYLAAIDKWGLASVALFLSVIVGCIAHWLVPVLTIGLTLGVVLVAARIADGHWLWM